MSKREIRRTRRHKRIRKKIFGTPDKPRVVVHRSHKNLMVQAVDDLNQKVLIGMSTLSKEFRAQYDKGGNIKGGEVLGKLFAEKAKAKGITKIVFDRGGYLYHGRIKAFAEALRKGGLEF